MAAVCGRACDEPGEVFDHAHLRPPTDVMVITSLPQDKEAAPKGNRRPDIIFRSRVRAIRFGSQIRDLHPNLNT